MPKVTVYLDDSTHELLKLLDLKPSELLQTAIHTAARTEEKMRLLGEWIEEYEEEHGPPSAEDLADAERILAPLRERQARERDAQTAQERRAS